MTPTHLIPVHPDRELHWLNEKEKEVTKITCDFCSQIAMVRFNEQCIIESITIEHSIFMCRGHANQWLKSKLSPVTENGFSVAELR